MRAAEIVDYKVINIHNLRDDAVLSSFPGQMIEVPDGLNVSSGYMYDGQRFYAPVPIQTSDSPVTPATPEPDPATEDDADDRPIGGDPTK